MTDYACCSNTSTVFMTNHVSKSLLSLFLCFYIFSFVSLTGSEFVIRKYRRRPQAADRVQNALRRGKNKYANIFISKGFLKHLVIKTIGIRKRHFDRSTVIIKQSEDVLTNTKFTKPSSLCLSARRSINT